MQRCTPAHMRRGGPRSLLVRAENSPSDLQCHDSQVRKHNAPSSFPYVTAPAEAHR